MEYFSQQNVGLYLYTYKSILLEKLHLPSTHDVYVF